MSFLTDLPGVAPLLVLIGGVLLVIGLVDGGLVIKEARIPRIAIAIRILSVALGLALISATLFVGQDKEQQKPLTLDEIKEEVDLETRLYRVCYVRADDWLNVREDPGVCYEGIPHAVFGKIPHDARGVEYRGKRALIGESYWYCVRYKSGDQSIHGWVNSYFLCPDDGPCTCRD